MSDKKDFLVKVQKAALAIHMQCLTLIGHSGGRINEGTFRETDEPDFNKALGDVSSLRVELEEMKELLEERVVAHHE